MCRDPPNVEGRSVAIRVEVGIAFREVVGGVVEKPAPDPGGRVDVGAHIQHVHVAHVVRPLLHDLHEALLVC
eukprot:3303171-Rhodomonas_salina.1